MAGAMIFGTDAVSSPPGVTLPTGNDYFFANGNGTSVEGTQVPDYWVNKVGGELDAIITSLGLTLSMTSRGQILSILQAGFAGILKSVAMPGLADPNNPTALGWATVSNSTGNLPFDGDYGVVYTISSIGSVTPGSGNFIRQTAYDVSSAQPGAEWFRTNDNTLGWSSWVQVAIAPGNASQAFSVANAGTSQQAVPLGQAQSLFAALLGSSGNQFAVATAALAASAVPLAQLTSILAGFAALSAFTTGSNANGFWLELPNGFIFQYGFAQVSSSGTSTSFPLPRSFNTTAWASMCSFGASVPPTNGNCGSDPDGLGGVDLIITGATGGPYGVHFWAVGF
jgi:hypothetical protein